MNRFGSMLILALFVSVFGLCGFSGCYTKSQICKYGVQMKMDMAVFGDAVSAESKDGIHDLCEQAIFKSRLQQDFFFVNGISKRNLKSFKKWFFDVYENFKVLCSLDNPDWSELFDIDSIKRDTGFLIRESIIPLGEALLEENGCL